MIRETLRDDSETRIGDTKKYILMRERIWCHGRWIPCYTTLLFFLSHLFNLSSNTFELSLFLCLLWANADAGCLLIRCSKWKNSTTKWQSCSQILKSWTAKSIFGCRLNWLRSQFSLFTLTLGQFVCLSLAWVHRTHWSAFSLLRLLSFSHSVTLSLCISICCCLEHNSRRRALLMWVLSHSDTHYLNRYMPWCGCHERSDQCRSSQGVYGMLRVPRNLDSLFYNCPVLDHFPSDYYSSRCG